MRAFPLAVALGAALTLPVSASAADGGAAPEPTAPGAAAPGSAAQAPPAPAAPVKGSAGGGGGGGGAGAKQSGGAAPGSKPSKPVKAKKARPKAKPRPKKRKQPARKAPVKQAPPAAPVTPVTPDPVAPTPGVETVAGVFPVQGAPYTFGGDGSRFGAGRPGHIHQGQDVAAAEGAPLVAPVAGTVTWKANQPGGAGIYLVLRGEADGRDYVFMHLRSGSVVVEQGTVVTAGQQLAEVGSTGVSSGPHLHFEIWVGGWQARGGAPIDPLPQLQRWAAGPA